MAVDKGGALQWGGGEEIGSGGGWGLCVSEQVVDVDLNAA